jgi:NADH-quinone oxidoreductase subunit L
MSRFVVLIPLLPFLGFLFNALVGRRLGRSPLVGLVACGTVAASFALSVRAALVAHAQPDHALLESLGPWIPGLGVEWAFLVDPLSTVMILVVTFVGLLIHVYSIGYMGHDPGYGRFMAYLNLFMSAMLTLVLGASYLVMFVGWEGVGLCSYLLIGFWFERPSAADAGKKAFVVNRVGDAFFLLGLFLMFEVFGTLDTRAVARAAQDMPIDWAWSGPLTLIALCLFGGATGKSAQVPLYVWLPDAMEGPTPVSALIHAATMVTAGVYMVARTGVLFAHAPRALLVVAVVGAVTAIFAASIGLVQNDIKRVLAYSTVSQLGYMFMACGVGAFGAGVFHLVTHAFFKALLFLGSGSVIHGMSGEQDMRRMGGLAAKLPWTHKTMLVGCVAIAGIPPLAGFVSKDEILWSAFKVGGYGHLVWGIGVLAAGLTAFYMFRLYHLTFGGAFRGTHEQEHHLHESPATMIVPLQVLAAGSIVVGFLGWPAALGGGAWFEHFLHPVTGPAQAALAVVFTSPEHAHAVEYALMAVSVAVAAAGIFAATRIYRAQPALADRLAERFAGAHHVLLNKYFVDEAYGRVVVRGLALGGGSALFGVDRFVIDGGDGELRRGLGVNGLAWLARDVVARFSGFWDRVVVDGAVNLTAAVLDNGSYAVRAVQDGLVQHYVIAMLTAVIALLGVGRLLLGP